MNEIDLTTAIAAGSAGLILGILVHSLLTRSTLRSAKERAKTMIQSAEKEADTARKQAILEAKEQWYQQKVDLEKEVKEQRNELQRLERRLAQRSDHLDRKLEVLEQRERETAKQERQLQAKEERVHRLEEEYCYLIAQEMEKLESIAHMTQEQAKEELKVKIVEEARQDAYNSVKKVEEEVRLEATQRARHLLSTAIQRISSDHVVETTVSVVDLPSDEMKGRIIGREGRNIRALEMATGVDLIIDDTPEAVIISSFDPYRRELARTALERLIADGRIHPGRIEEVVAKVSKEMEEKMIEEGRQAAFEVGVEGLHPEEIKLLGRLKYRYSYSQNMLHHSKEVAHLCGLMAAELGTDANTAKRAGLLHDIGKAADHRTEGSHTSIGVEITKRYNESQAVVNAIAAHHEDEEPKSLEAVLLQAADALSAARPGARREMLESYIRRLEKLEEICNSFRGVAKSYAIQAGREIRVMVIPEEIRDYQAAFLARDIARKIEKELAYPGEIKVTIVREVRAVDYAK